MKKLNILALNPFHGGSHKAFLENWIKRSKHNFTLLTLPGTQWRWRLHFAAVEFSQQVKDLYDKGERWDAIFCTSMMDLPDFKGLTSCVSNLPATVYFHENQLTYPVSTNVKFDLGRCITNIKSAFVADHIWFNSAFHLQDFLSAAEKLLEQKPGTPISIVDEIRQKASVKYQGIEEDFYKDAKRQFSKPVKLVWASRWEEDKNPGLLFSALKILKEKELAFELFVMGEEMGTEMDCFQKAKIDFADEIKHFGFAESRQKYKEILKDADIFISTADHEFFGISAVEAVASGCIPIVPNKLSYPEVLDQFSDYFYKARSSVALASKIEASLSLGSSPDFNSVKKFIWGEVSDSLDDGMLRN